MILLIGCARIDIKVIMASVILAKINLYVGLEDDMNEFNGDVV
jgi:hypothetical protein